MESHTNKQDGKFDLLTSGTLDTSGTLFVAAALFAVVAAVIIIYRTADSLAF